MVPSIVDEKKNATLEVRAEGGFMTFLMMIVNGVVMARPAPLRLRTFPELELIVKGLPPEEADTFEGNIT